MAISSTFSVLFLSVFCIGVASGQFNCFVCQSPRNVECDDPYNITAGRSYDCSTLNYGTRSASDVDVPLLDILRTERINSNTTFGCLKVHVTYTNNTDGIVRSCQPITPTIADQCDFIRNEVYDFRVESCHFCNDDRCNSASHISVSRIVTVAATLIAYLRA